MKGEASEGTKPPQLERRIGLTQAVAANVLGMVGVGPFLTIPAMLRALDGPQILYAWLLGAVLALSDGLVYAQLGAALPGSGGPYVYLLESYRKLGLGRPLAFLFLFQVLLAAPLSIASGAVGFANYLGFFVAMSPLVRSLIAAVVCLLVTALLYRPIAGIGKLSVAMLVVVFATVGWVIVSGLAHTSLPQAFASPPADGGAFLRRLGPVTLFAIYNYGGYNNVCNIGGEVKEAAKTIPRAIVISILLVVAIYLAMSTAILGVVPWREAAASETIASAFIAKTFSNAASAVIAAQLMTVLVLFVTGASLFAVLLGYSRVPYAAAAAGEFFPVFARLHPDGFPTVSLVCLGIGAVPFCFLDLGSIINELILVQIVTQFLAQCAAVVVLKKTRPDVTQPFLMNFYPLPALLAFVLWAYVYLSSPWQGELFAGVVTIAGLLAYTAFDRYVASRAERRADTV